MPGLAVSLLCSLAITGCSGIQSAIDPASPQSEHISKLWWLMFCLLSIVFLSVMVVLVLAAFRSRRVTAQADVSLSIDGASEKRTSRVVSGAVATTIVILFVLLTSSFLTGRAIFSTPAKDSEVLTIEITGHQWWWAIRYANKMPSQIVTTANEIHVPAGQLIHFKLSSTDVIHSFWVPNLNGKTDLIPGHPADTWIQPKFPGTFRGQCAEFCGYQHAHMAFAVVVESEAQFQAWYEAQLQSSIAPLTDTQKRGQQVFLAKPCVMCHRIQGTDAGGNVGPDLTHLASRQTIGAGTLSNTREHLAQWITDAQQFKPGNRMPPNPMSTEELNALLDYLESLK
jgi:cytochrome c oxidase subunit II